MNVLDLMLKKVITDPKVYTTLATASLREVVTLMTSRDVGSVCIVDTKGLITGIFTERDFLKKVGVNASQELLEKPISEFMTGDPVTTKEETKIRDCFGLMRMGKFRHLIIANDDGTPKRMLSIRDAFFFLCDSIQ